MYQSARIAVRPPDLTSAFGRLSKCLPTIARSNFSVNLYLYSVAQTKFLVTVALQGLK